MLLPQGWVWHKPEPCVPRTDQSCYPQQTSQTLDRKPNRLISCHCQPQFNYSWTTSRGKKQKQKQHNKQATKSQTKSPIYCLWQQSLSHWTLWCVTEFCKERLSVSRCQVDTKNCAPICAQKKNEKGTLESSAAGHRQGYISRTEGSPTWSPLRLRMLDSSISPSAFSEPLTTV